MYFFIYSSSKLSRMKKMTIIQVLYLEQIYMVENQLYKLVLNTKLRIVIACFRQL